VARKQQGPTDALASEQIRGTGKGDALIASRLWNKLLIRIDPTWYDVYQESWEPIVAIPGVLDVDPQGFAFTFVDLEEGITEQSSVNYADADVVGRAEAYKTFISTGNKEVPITFQIRAQGEAASGLDLKSILLREVVYPARWLDALKYPLKDTKAKLTIAPPPCILQIGSLFIGRVIATDVQLQWMPPFDPDTLLPHGCEAQCTFTVVRRIVGNYPMSGVWGAKEVKGASIYGSADRG
jgi:hypothetical protein